MDAKSFWQAIGCRAIGAAVVAATDAEGPAGFLALSATHLSADPPRMMVSVDLKTSALRPIRNSKHFAISYLRKDQEQIASTFGGRGDLKGADRFQAGQWDTMISGAPTLKDAIGVLDCEVEEIIERGQTAIVIGRLVANRASADAQPLISFRGKYV